MFETANMVAWEPKKINCPKHGTHSYTIDSSIPGYEGQWCQICWVESLGPSLPVVDQTDD